MVSKMIYDDFVKIKSFLRLPNDIQLKIWHDSDEGFYNKKEHTVKLGIKSGYNRRLLVHECVHVTGKQHYEDGFESIIRYDKFSAELEGRIFSNE